MTIVGRQKQQGNLLVVNNGFMKHLLISPLLIASLSISFPKIINAEELVPTSRELKDSLYILSLAGCLWGNGTLSKRMSYAFAAEMMEWSNIRKRLIPSFIVTSGNNYEPTEKFITDSGGCGKIIDKKIEKIAKDWLSLES